MLQQRKGLIRNTQKQKDNVKNWSFALLELQVPELLPKGLLLSRSSQTGRPKHRRVVPIERELISESSLYKSRWRWIVETLESDTIEGRTRRIRTKLKPNNNKESLLWKEHALGNRLLRQRDQVFGSAENMKNYHPTTHDPLETTGRQFRRGKALLKWGHNMREAQGFNEV